MGCNLLQPVIRHCGRSVGAARPHQVFRKSLTASGGGNKLVCFPTIDESDEDGENPHNDNCPVDLEDEDASLDWTE